MEKFAKCWVYKSFAAAILLSVMACQESTPVASNDDPEEANAGGSTTSFDATSKAFTFPLTNISSPDLQMHKNGDAVFEATFVTPPATVNGGLGPIYNNTSCKSCHNNDGRARPPLANEQFGGLLFRISMPGADAHGGPLPVPGFGLQVQNNAVFGVLPEMTIQISYAEIPGKFADGTDYSLQKPTYTMVNPYLPVPSDVLLSPRIANANFGLGLLDAITEQTILSYADENDVNGDGISGKANYVYDQAQDKVVLGRYGWKASQPTLVQQSAAAANGDMGITSTYFPEEASKGQTQDVPAHDVEMTADQLSALTVYLQTLAPPARRNASDGTVQKGRSLFIQAKCAACHIPKIQTGAYSISELANQTIRPYTDLLLHDMGEGLADGRPDFKASGNEWRTAPLWGIGLTQVVNGHTNFLHDGRARNLTEAILWHGGEAEKSKQAFLAMTATERAALLKFLNSL